MKKIRAEIELEVDEGFLDGLVESQIRAEIFTEAIVKEYIYSLLSDGGTAKVISVEVF